MQALFEEHKSLADHIARKYVAKFPMHKDDLHQEAYRGLWYAIINRGMIENLGAWMVSNICRFLNDYIRSQAMLGYRRKRKLESNFNGVENVPEKRKLSVIEVRDIIDSCSSDETDKRILRMRFEGYNDREISEKLNVSNSTIQAKRVSIGKRYTKQMIA